MKGYSPRLDEALSFAARAHVRQMRKGTDVPYFTHLVHVAWILRGYGFEEDVVIGGLLHDLLEDTAVTAGEIAARFGPRVALIVEGATEPDHEFGYWEDRKEDMIEFLRTAHEDVRAVVCADKLHNLSTTRDAIAEAGERVWRRFGRGKLDQAWYYRSAAQALGQSWSHPMLDELRGVIREVFGE
jgi:(p)ppGpp synthase/HD superfamily hydrolase